MTNVIDGRNDPHADRCCRCGGLMVPEKVQELGSIDWHCLSCGERIDQIILTHRRESRPAAEEHRAS